MNATVIKSELVHKIEDLRTYLNSADHTLTPQIEALARDYSSACRSANERLERCSGLLRKGHRPEAISLAEAEPDLLQLVALLDFPELDIWHSLVASYGIERSPRLKLDVATAIAEAYALEAQLAELLDENRALAIREAPIKQRLALLRRIAEADSTTPFWREDVHLFERHRAEELLREGEAALATGKLNVVEKFVGAYDAENWFQVPNGELKNLHHKAATAVALQRTLPDLAQQVQAVAARRDLQTLQELRSQWGDVERRLASLGESAKIPYDLTMRVAPVFEQLDLYLSKERRAAFDRDVVVLLNAVRSERAYVEVEMLQAAAESHGFPLPRDVLTELAGYRRQETQGKAMSIMMVILAIACFLTIVVLIYLMYQRL